jgi:predicted metalloprotease with PDZ domain
MTNHGLSYRIEVPEPGCGELLVDLEVPMAAWSPATGSPAAGIPAHGTGADARAAEREVLVFLPAWTPGSYLVRDYSRHLSRIAATDAVSGATVACRKVSKNRFALTVPATTERLRLSYRVYAHELSVRTADVTGEHAFWNHACLLLWPVDRPLLPAIIEVVFPEAWQLACALPACPTESAEARPATIRGRQQVRRLLARDMEHAFDSPCLVGSLQVCSWTSLGVRHSIVMDGLAGVEPPASLTDDLGRIVEAAAAVFGGPLPYPEYAFLCLFAADGHGGLEHRDSTTLLFARTALGSDKGYREFLGLAAHELFHAWNVKRLRPVEFWAYDYERENYTSFLWLIEGWTAYYDDLLCLRAGLLSRSDYLEIVAKNINSTMQAPGRLRLSLAESSFDAWIRLYRPDENTRNSSQNYYVNGSVAALALDLMIRCDSGGKASLDDVLRRLWTDTYAAGRGFGIEDVSRAVLAVASPNTLAAMMEFANGKLDPQLAPLLASVGIRLQVRDAERAFLGLQFESGSTVAASITAGSPAHLAGLQPGDEVLALQGLRVDSNRWQDVFQAVARPGATVEMLLARRGVVQRLPVVAGKSAGTVALEVDESAPESARHLRELWLAARPKDRSGPLPVPAPVQPT